MNNINKYNILRFWLLTAMVLIFSAAAYAQYDTQGQSQGQTSASQDVTSFGNNAQKFANTLAQQLGATSGVADKITQALIDYRSNIAQARQDYLSKNQSGNSGNQDVTGGQSRGTSNIDSAPDLMSDYRKADEQADKDIISALDNDAQINKYIQIKKQWWQDVKNAVYSSVKQTSGQQQNSDQQMR